MGAKTIKPKRRAWKDNPFLMNRDWILDQRKKGESYEKIAEKAGTSRNSLRKAVEFHNIPKDIIIIHDKELAEGLGLPQNEAL